jgi:hypothetical protein
MIFNLFDKYVVIIGSNFYKNICVFLFPYVFAPPCNGSCWIFSQRKSNDYLVCKHEKIDSLMRDKSNNDSFVALKID